MDNLEDLYLSLYDLDLSQLLSASEIKEYFRELEFNNLAQDLLSKSSTTNDVNSSNIQEHNNNLEEVIIDTRKTSRMKKTAVNTNVCLTQNEGTDNAQNICMQTVAEFDNLNLVKRKSLVKEKGVGNIYENFPIVSDEIFQLPTDNLTELVSNHNNNNHDKYLNQNASDFGNLETDDRQTTESRYQQDSASTKSTPGSIIYKFDHIRGTIYEIDASMKDDLLESVSYEDDEIVLFNGKDDMIYYQVRSSPDKKPISLVDILKLMAVDTDEDLDLD